MALIRDPYKGKIVNTDWESLDSRNFDHNRRHPEFKQTNFNPDAYGGAHRYDPYKGRVVNTDWESMDPRNFR